MNPDNSVWHIRKEARQRCLAVGIANLNEVDQLLEAMLQVSSLALLPSDRLLSPHEQETFSEMLRRRLKREPLQHILGFAHFYGLRLAVGPGCFVPRPETEIMVEQASQKFAAMLCEAGKTHICLDLCSGSGAVLLGIAKQLAEWKVRIPNDVSYLLYGVEKSQEAFTYLRKNLDNHPQFQSYCEIIRGDALEVGLRKVLPEKASLIVTNPPYVPRGEVHQEEALADPNEALYGGGEDGLDIPLAIIKNSTNLLAQGGTLMMEHHPSQAEVLRDVAKAAGFKTAETICDLTGRERFLLAEDFLF